MARFGRSFPIKAHVTQILGPQPPPLLNESIIVLNAVEFNLARRRRTIRPAPHITQILGPQPAAQPPIGKQYLITRISSDFTGPIQRRRRIFPAHVLPGIPTEFEPAATAHFSIRRSRLGRRWWPIGFNRFDELS